MEKIHKVIQKIKPNNFAIILGSGASIEHIPGTSKLTESLKLWDYYTVPMSQGAAPSGMDILNWMKSYTKSPSCPYFQCLYGQSHLFFNDPKNSLHFERLIYLCLLLDGVSRNPKTRDDMASLYRPFLKFVEGKEIWNSPSTHSLVADHACRFILEQIYDAQEKNKAHLKADSLNIFIQKVHQMGFVPNIFTLNYDTVPLQSNLKFETGFSYYREGVESFDPSRLWHTEGLPLFIQLHGSILFGDTDGGRDEDGFIGYLARYEDPKVALEHREVPMGGYPRHDGTAATTNYMITGLRKAEDIIREPYASYFQKLYETLVSTENWLVVGYGGSDPHLNSVMLRALKIRNKLQRKTNIVYVVYSPADHFADNDTSMWEPGYPIHDAHSNNMGWWLASDVVRQMRSKNGSPATYFWINRKSLNIVETPLVKFGMSFLGTKDTFLNMENDLMQFFSIEDSRRNKVVAKIKEKSFASARNLFR